MADWNNEIVRCTGQRVTRSGTGDINICIWRDTAHHDCVFNKVQGGKWWQRPTIVRRQTAKLMIIPRKTHRMIDQGVCWSHICCIYQMMSLGVLIPRRRRPQGSSKCLSGWGCRRRQWHPRSLLKMLSSSLDIASDHGFTRPNRFLWCFWRHKGRSNHGHKHFLRY